MINVTKALTHAAVCCLGLALTTSCTTAQKQDFGEIIDNGSFAFNVHFLVVSDRRKVVAAATEAQMRTEVDILNQYFESRSGEKLVLFVYKSTKFRREIGTDCQDLKDLGNARQDYGDGSAWNDAINDCTDDNVIDPHAINFIVYDSWTTDDKFGHVGSHGRRNSNRPYVLIDYARLNHALQAAEEHEMGHAFGLSHVCVPGAIETTSTNIMASTNGCAGQGGMRDLGFEPDQVDTILEYAEEIRDKLAI